jgi:hypothetical protein
MARWCAIHRICTISPEFSPYRLLDSLGLNDQTIIISMRFISIALFAIGLLLFRSYLVKPKHQVLPSTLLYYSLYSSRRFPLAGQLNYDNLQFPLMALALLLTVNLANRYKTKK